MLIAYRGKTPRIARTAFIAPNAVLIGDVEVGEGSSIWFGVVLRGDNGPIRVGARTSVQDNAVLHVSGGGATIVGDDVTIGHGACLEDCTIEDRALIGTNSTVLNGARVGAGTLVAAGSVVGMNADLPPGMLVAGAPAVVKRPLAGIAADWIASNAEKYVALSRSYLDHGIGDAEFHEVAEVRAKATP